MTFVHNLNQSFKKDKNDLTNKHSDLKNYVDLNFSSHPRIRKSEGNTLVDSKKSKKIEKGKINNIEVMICTID